MIFTIIALILQLTLIVIVFSLPSRFREQRDYMDQRFKEMEEKLDILQAALGASSATSDDESSKTSAQLGTQQQ